MTYYVIYIRIGIILTQFYINFSRQEHQIDVLYVSFKIWDSQVSAYTPFHFSFTVPLNNICLGCDSICWVPSLISSPTYVRRSTSFLHGFNPGPGTCSRVNIKGLLTYFKIQKYCSNYFGKLNLFSSFLQLCMFLDATSFFWRRTNWIPYLTNFLTIGCIKKIEGAVRLQCCNSHSVWKKNHLPYAYIGINYWRRFTTTTKHI